MLGNVHVGWGSVGLFNNNTFVPSLKLNQKKVTLELNSEFILYITSEYEETPIWKSSNSSVATVDQNGNIKAVGYGFTLITVTSGKMKGSCLIQVPKPVEEPVIPDQPSIPENKLNKNKIYYGTVTPNENFFGYSDFTEKDFITAVDNGTLIESDLEELSLIDISVKTAEAIVILIPKTSNFKAFKTELGTEKEFYESNTGVGIHANGEIVIGNFKVFGEWITASNFDSVYLINVH